MEGINIRKINKLKKEIGLDREPEDDIFRSYDIEDIKGIKLMHKNEPVLYFNNRREIVILNEELVPLQIRDVKYMDLTVLLQFIRSRSISVRRKYYKDIVNYMGIQQEASEYAIILKTQALSLQDHYWIKIPSNPQQTWEEINLFENKFSDAISFIAFTGSRPTVQNSMRTPEVATGGIYPKCWRRIEGEIYLFKASLSNGIEAETEVFSSRVASFLSDNVLNYDFEVYENRNSSRCKIFTSLELEEVSSTNLSKYLIRNKINFGDFILREFRDYYFELLLVDSVVNNRDRHNSNYSFLLSSSGILKPAPIFDLNNTMSEEDNISLLDPSRRDNLVILRELLKRKSVEEKILNLVKAINDGRLDKANMDLIKHNKNLYEELKSRLKTRLSLALASKGTISW